jgi:hypothetical protein
MKKLFVFLIVIVLMASLALASYGPGNAPTTAATAAPAAASSSTGGSSGGGGGNCAPGFVLVAGNCVSASDDVAVPDDDAVEAADDGGIPSEAAPSEDDSGAPIGLGEDLLTGPSFGRTLIQLSWLWATVVVVAVIAGIGVFLYRRRP